MMSEIEHVVEDLAAYALGSLDKAEVARIAAHLRSCGHCRTELVAYQETVGALAYAVPQTQPAADLRSRLQDKVRMSQGQVPLGHKNWWSRWSRLFTRPIPAWSLGLVSLALLIVLGMFILQAPSTPEPLATVALVGTDHSSNATGLVILSADGEYGSLVVDGLPELGSDQAYQLWLIQDGERTSGGVLSTHEGYGQLEIVSPVPLSNYDAYGITIEPAGGSPGPTGEKVLGSD
jgi:anti-sigma-K factor RskA